MTLLIAFLIIVDHFFPQCVLRLLCPCALLHVCFPSTSFQLLNSNVSSHYHISAYCSSHAVTTSSTDYQQTINPATTGDRDRGTLFIWYSILRSQLKHTVSTPFHIDTNLLVTDTSTLHSPMYSERSPSGIQMES